MAWRQVLQVDLLAFVAAGNRGSRRKQNLMTITKPLKPTRDKLVEQIEQLWETPGRNILEAMAHDGDTALGLERARELMAKINRLRSRIVAIDHREAVKRNRK